MEAQTHEESVGEATDAEAEWHAKRLTGIGGSDAGAVDGCDPWQHEFELYSRKVGLIGPKEVGEAAMWGKLHEPTIRQWYRDETGRDVIGSHSAGDITGATKEIAGKHLVLRSKEHPFMLANLDGAVFDDDKGFGVLEIKTSGWPEAWEEGPPPWCVAQMQHYLAVTGLQWGAFAVLFKGNKGGHMDVERDDAYIEQLVEKEREFWRRVTEGDPPDPDTSESSDRTLREIYSKSSGETVVLDEEADHLIAVVENAKLRMGDAEEAKRSAMARLRAMMGAAKQGNTPDGGKVLRVDVRETLIEPHTKEPYSYLRTTPRE